MQRLRLLASWANLFFWAAAGPYGRCNQNKKTVDAEEDFFSIQAWVGNQTRWVGVLHTQSNIFMLHGMRQTASSWVIRQVGDGYEKGVIGRSGS